MPLLSSLRIYIKRPIVINNYNIDIILENFISFINSIEVEIFNKDYYDGEDFTNKDWEEKCSELRNKFIKNNIKLNSNSMDEVIKYIIDYSNTTRDDIEIEIHDCIGAKKLLIKKNIIDNCKSRISLSGIEQPFLNKNLNNRFRIFNFNLKNIFSKVRHKIEKNIFRSHIFDFRGNEINRYNSL